MLSTTNLLQQNVIIGSMQLRQIRVGNKTCIIHPDFAEHIATCYAAYSQYSESTEAYGSMRMRQNDIDVLLLAIYSIVCRLFVCK